MGNRRTTPMELEFEASLDDEHLGSKDIESKKELLASIKDIIDMFYSKEIESVEERMRYKRR